ncbi:hypothetical protein HPB51_026398 [Rhipicephalus microplus]|uniref:Peptidase M13 N-terminal domain-containing protein n=1 Tax=Rhipicephalus microplus TaxID=6941 RepID=A0A9J6D396_RHIMP|nr:hypothetical protein HPB51_026398 [Rhipicephalus microplus]
MTALHILVNQCDFGNCKDRIVRDRFVVGLRDREEAILWCERRRQRLLVPVPEQPMTLARAEEALTMMAPVATKRTLGSCDMLDCREMTEELRATLDDRVSPCSDFYQHVCGKWVLNHTPELGEALVSERTLRRRRLELQLLLELRAGTDDGSMRWPLHLWRECSTTTGEPHSHDVLRTIFAMHGLAGFPFSAADRHRDLSTTAAKYVVTVKRSLF